MIANTVKIIKFSSINAFVMRIVAVSNNCNNLLPLRSLSGRKQLVSKNSGFEDGFIEDLS
jgi:hypothetical protein